MKTTLHVLSQEECSQIHEASVHLLGKTGVRVLSERARKILKDAGAEVNEQTHNVRIPRDVIEESLRLSPHSFNLGARRPGWDLEMNAGNCWLAADGGAVSVLDRETGDLRPGTLEDWLTATRLIDAIAEIGVFWNMIEGDFFSDTPGDFVSSWRHILMNCSKHVQDSTSSADKSRLLLEILNIVFGDRETIRQKHPFSFLLCPMSPLVIDETYIDAYLETVEYQLPVAIMPMPLMGATGPASLFSTLVTANSETMAMLCIVQTAAPGTPALYAPVPQSIEPHTWRFTGGAIENSIFGAAVTEMGRFYGLPVEGSSGGTDHYSPGAQAGYERALNWTLPSLAWPDILVGPGLLGGSSILSLEQMLIDVETFKRCSRLKKGIESGTPQRLDECIDQVGPGGNFLKHPSTLKAIRQGTWYLSSLGFHDTYEKWKTSGRPDITDGIREEMERILKNHQPLPLEAEAERELGHLEARARDLDH